MKLGKIIKQYRDDNHMSMDEFASKSGISKGYISMLEKNRNPATGKGLTPSLAVIKQVAEAIGISLTDILLILDPEQDINIEEPSPTTDTESKIENLSKKYNIDTLAAHHDDYEWTDEELDEVENFILCVCPISIDLCTFL